MLPKLIVSLLTASCSPRKAYTHELTVQPWIYVYAHSLPPIYKYISFNLDRQSIKSHIKALKLNRILYRDMPQQNGTPGYCGDQVSDVDYWAPEPPTYEEYEPPLHKPSNSRASPTPDRAVSQQNNATFSHVEFGSSPSVRAEDSSLNARYEPTNIQCSHKLTNLSVYQGKCCTVVGAAGSLSESLISNGTKLSTVRGAFNVNFGAVGGNLEG